jgi:hypothetical protein
MEGVLLAGPRIAELLEVATAGSIGPVHGIAEDEILRRFRLRGDEGVDRLARAGVFDAAVEVGIMDRRSFGPVVHDCHSSGGAIGTDLPHSVR